MVKIKSITDIITNSSSEAFTIIPPNSVEKIKKGVDELIKLAGIDFTFDDLFEIEQVGITNKNLGVYEFEDSCEALDLDHNQETVESLIKKSKIPGIEYDHLASHSEGYPRTEQRYRIVPKLGEYGDAADALSEMLNGTFEAIYVYC